VTDRDDHWRRSTDPPEELMQRHRIFTTAFASVYPHYVRKAEAKGREREEVDRVICWLTGYTPEALAEQIERKKDFESFFGEAPAMHPRRRPSRGFIASFAPPGWTPRESTIPTGAVARGVAVGSEGSTDA
jgi:hypothetical protein